MTLDKNTEQLFWYNPIHQIRQDNDLFHHISISCQYWKWSKVSKPWKLSQNQSRVQFLFFNWKSIEKFVKLMRVKIFDVISKNSWNWSKLKLLILKNCTETWKCRISFKIHWKAKMADFSQWLLHSEVWQVEFCT